jgi:predicted NAD/FAD-dependent oxidoreductase
LTAFEPSKYGHYYQALLETGILRVLPADTILGGRGSHYELRHYAAPLGIAAVPKFFLGEEAHVSFGKRLVTLSKSADDRRWLLIDERGERDHADIVVLTCPVPQAQPSLTIPPAYDPPTIPLSLG